MKKLILGALFYLAVTPGYLTAASAVNSEFGGMWNNVDPQTRGINKVLINVSDRDVLVNIVAKCFPADCNWGTTKAAFDDSNTIVATYEVDFKKVTLRISLENAQTMMIQSNSQYTSKSEIVERTYYLNRDTTVSVAPIGVAE